MHGGNMSMCGLAQRLPSYLERIIPSSGEFIPKHVPAIRDDVQALREFINGSHKILVLSGAGISTESGIPDYRSEEVGLYARSNHRPVQHIDFLRSANVRQRYWARNYVGWPKFSQSKPNVTHYVVHLLETVGKISGVVTQNVDGLHTKAASSNVIELHGTAFRVICLECGHDYDRHEVQRKLTGLNPDLQESTDVIRPDGDVEISQEKMGSFNPPFCDRCGGALKPDITFFGDNVPKERVESVKSNVTASDSLLVLGSSLSVFSGYRIVLQAYEEKKKIAIVNIGATRGDKLASLKLSARCGDILMQMVDM